jgi:threonine dehydratase
VSVRLPAAADLQAAAERLEGRVRTTPVLELAGSELGLPGRLLLKLELSQHTGSFKARGALNSLLAAGAGSDGVVAASGGNHGAAVAWAARSLGLPATVFVPSTSPAAKLDRVRSFGADVRVVEGYYPAAAAAASEWAEHRDVLAVPAYDGFDVVCGQATVGMELLDQAPGVAHVVVGCGGGGLFSGTALAGADAFTVTPVEPDGCPTMSAALAAGRPVDVAVGGVASDSMGAPRIGETAFAVTRRLGTASALVTGEAVLEARRWLWDRCRVLAEPGGAVALAGVLSGAVSCASDVVVVVSGGNSADVPDGPARPRAVARGEEPR